MRFCDYYQNRQLPNMNGPRTPSLEVKLFINFLLVLPKILQIRVLIFIYIYKPTYYPPNLDKSNPIYLNI